MWFSSTIGLPPVRGRVSRAISAGFSGAAPTRLGADAGRASSVARKRGRRGGRAGRVLRVDADVRREQRGAVGGHALPVDRRWIRGRRAGHGETSSSAAATRRARNRRPGMCGDNPRVSTRSHARAPARRSATCVRRNGVAIEKDAVRPLSATARTGAASRSSSSSGATAEAVSLGVSSATVAQPGGTAQVCVSLVTGGEEVAGTQNDLVWDGTCMTLNDNACSAAGSHGKQVNTRIQNSADFRMRVLVLSLSDVDPIDDGVLYCCQLPGRGAGAGRVATSRSSTPAPAIRRATPSAASAATPAASAHRAAAAAAAAAVRSAACTGDQQANSIANNPAPLDQGMPAGNSGGGNTGPGGAAPPAGQVLQGGGGGAQVPAAGSGAQVLPGGGVAGSPRRRAQAPQVAQAPATPIAVPTRAAAAPVAARRAGARAGARGRRSDGRRRGTHGAADGRRGSHRGADGRPAHQEGGVDRDRAARDAHRLRAAGSVVRSATAPAPHRRWRSPCLLAALAGVRRRRPPHR